MSISFGVVGCRDENLRVSFGSVSYSLFCAALLSLDQSIPRFSTEEDGDLVDWKNAIILATEKLRNALLRLANTEAARKPFTQTDPNDIVYTSDDMKSHAFQLLKMLAYADRQRSNFGLPSKSYRELCEYRAARIKEIQNHVKLYAGEYDSSLQLSRKHLKAVILEIKNVVRTHGFGLRTLDFKN